MVGEDEVARIKVGDRVTGNDGGSLGVVREIHPHFLLAGQPDAPHSEREIPVHAILAVDAGEVRVSVTTESTTEVDENESFHRRGSSSS